MRLQLAIALYHQERFAESSEELETADRLIADERAEIALYRGLLLLTAPGPQRAADAAAWLEQARVLDARSVEPIASYYAGIGWSAASDEARARQALERVVSEWPGTPWAQQAQQRLDEIGPAGRRIWGSLRAGIEYDSNTVLQGQGVPLPSEISSQRDWVGVWQGHVGSELWRSERWSVGASVGYAGNVHVDIESFDSQFPSFAAWVDHRLDAATTLRFAADTGYAWVDYESFLWTYRGSLSAFRQWREAGMTEAFARFWRDDYYQISDDVPDGTGAPGSECPRKTSIGVCGPPGLDERSARNRDGSGVTVGALHSAQLPVPWPFGQLELRAGYEFERFAARGSEYSYQEHSLAAGLRTPLPWRFVLDVSGSFSWRPYRHPSTFPDPDDLFLDTEYGLDDDDRDETTAQVDIVLERPITAWLTASARWHWEKNDSNVAVFAYDREVVGAYLTATFGH